MTPERKKIEYRFFIDRNGNWFQDGIKVRHRWTYLYNNKLLDRDRHGRYFVDEGSGRLYVRVEDAPFVVKMVNRKDNRFYIILNDETEERLDFGSFRMSGENIPYTRVKGGKFEARFTRPAYYELMRYARNEGNGYFIEEEGHKHYLSEP